MDRVFPFRLSFFSHEPNLFASAQRHVANYHYLCREIQQINHNRTMHQLTTMLTAAMMAIAIPAAAQPDGRHHRHADDAPVPQAYHILTSQKEQTIEHFGASDAWSMQYIGLWPEEQQRQIADWLFSTEDDEDGRPKGIGLSLWRMNLGAGSMEQGDSAHISRSTRTECLLRPDGSWDWDRQLGQRRFLRLAHERGVPRLLLFCNSAPVQMTKNGLATNTGRGGDINLRDDCYDAFALFMAKAVRGIEERDGVRIDYISPVNEPDGHWNWLGPKQEGSPATNREISRLAKAMSRTFRREAPHTKIVLNESSDLRCLLGIYEAGWERGNTIATLFGRDSTAIRVKGLPGIEDAVLGHAYWTNTPVEEMRRTRLAIRDAVRKYGISYWQSEVCIMDNDKEIGGGNGYDFSMNTALYVARMIHYDLVYGNASSWSWWRAAGGDYKDGLIRIYSSDRMRTGHAVDSKLMWALGNYSRFIRPGATRLGIRACDSAGNVIEEGDTRPYGTMVSAYLNADGRMAVVAINYSERMVPLTLDADGREQRWRLYRTSDRTTESLAPVGTATSSAILPPRSITTFVEER